MGLLLCGNACADAVFLHGGEKLIGKILAEEPAKIIFESRTLGQLEIPRDRIERIEREAPASKLSTVEAAPVADTNPPAMSAPVARAFQGQFYPWTTGSPGGDSFDWVQLKSGEWLKGRLKSLQEEKLEFDSEELDLHFFDWKNILTVRSPRLKSVRLDKGKPLEGSLLVTTNEVRIMSQTETNTFPRAELIAITPTGDREVDKWSGRISVGVSFL
jgi:hypothetical protein